VIRINLLPPEIAQKRKDEKRWRWVAFGGIAAVIALGLVFSALQLQVAAKQYEVASVQQQADALQQKADKFKIFQEKKADLENRKSIAAGALLGRMDWSKLLSEICLVLPSDIYLTRIGVSEPKNAPPAPGTVSIDGKALDYPNDVPDLGYKSVAKLLVRLAELDRLDSVWLASSSKPEQTAAPAASGTGVATAPIDYYILFSLTSGITVTSTSTANASGVPAPPAP
jgi:Tfp pilus assembly protein PilN